MKYIVMSGPEPSRKPFERRVNERLAEMQKIDPAAAVANYHKVAQGNSRETKRRRSQAIAGKEHGILSARCFAVAATGSGNLSSWFLMVPTASSVSG